MKHTLTWLPRIVLFSLWYLKAMVDSNWAVIRDNLTPGQDATPGIARIRTDCYTEFEITLLASLVSLTPGTLSLGSVVDDDGVRTLVVHSMYDATADEARAHIAVMERRMLNAVRRQGVLS